MKFETSIKSIIGERKEQQDTISLFEYGKLLCAIVCDGMGGLGGGEEASKIAVETFKKNIAQTNGSIEKIPEFFLNCIDVLDESVFNLTDENGTRRGAGTTIVSVILAGNSCFWMSIGDSRLYILRQGEMLQATRDHNYFYTLNQLLQSGEITTDEYDIEKTRGEALTSYLGIGGVEFMDICQVPFFLDFEDILLVTTDGLYKTLSDQQIQSILTTKCTVEEMANKLIELIKMKRLPNQDNASFILIKAKGESNETDKV